MTPRERVLTALRREQPDQTPKHIRCSPALAAKLREAIGTDDIDSYFGLEIRFVGFDADSSIPDVTRYLGALPEGATVSPWGGVWVRGDYYHFGRRIAPMRDFTKLSEIDEYPFPNFAPRLDAMRERAKSIQSAELAAVSNYEPGPYEQACALRGQAEFLADLAANERFAMALLDRITQVKCEIAEAYVKTGDDG